MYRKNTVIFRYFSMFCLIFGLGGTALTAFASENEGIRISATGKASVQPEIAKLNLSFESTQKDVASASTTTEKQVAKLLKELNKFSIEKSSLDSSQLNVSPIYNYDDGKRTLTGHQVTRFVNFTLSDLSQLSDLIRTLTQSGLSRLNGLNFDLKDRSSAQQQALLNAIEQTRSNAQVIADGYGVKLGKIKLVEHSIESGGSPAPMPVRAMAFEAGQAPTADNYEIKHIDFYARVTATFDID